MHSLCCAAWPQAEEERHYSAAFWILNGGKPDVHIVCMSSFKVGEAFLGKDAFHQLPLPSPSISVDETHGSRGDLWFLPKGQQFKDLYRWVVQPQR